MADSETSQGKRKKSSVGKILLANNLCSKINSSHLIIKSHPSKYA